MKLLTFKLGGVEHLGALTDTGVVSLSAAAPKDLMFSSMQHFIEAGEPALFAPMQYSNQVQPQYHLIKWVGLRHFRYPLKYVTA